MANLRSAGLGAVLVATVLVALGNGAWAQTAGTLDTAFGSNGFALRERMGDGEANYYAMALDSSGRIVAAGSSGGQWAVHRFLANGAVDPTFNASALPAGYAATDVAVDAQGRIVVVGRCGTFGTTMLATVVRLRGDGGLDSTFGGGIVQVAIDEKAWAQAVEIQDDGRIVVAGTCRNRRGYTSIFVARFLGDGSLDTGSFGSGGCVVDDFDRKTSEGVRPGALAVRSSDHKIFVGGYDGAITTDTDAGTGWTLVRYNGDGSRDTAFGSQGIVRHASLASYPNIYLAGLALHTGNRVLACGSGWNSVADGLLVRYDDYGNLDTGFGDQGVARAALDPEHYSVQFRQMAVDASSRIVLGGDVLDLPLVAPIVQRKVAFRFTALGILDPAFGPDHDGKSQAVRLGQTYQDYGRCLVIDRGNGILLGGSSHSAVEPSNAYMSIVRFHAEPVTTTPPVAPSGLLATEVAPNRINLTWADNSATEVGFEIWRSPDGVDGWAQIDTVVTDVTSYGDTGLDPETTYFFRVRAYNVAGPSDWSNTASDTTPASVAPVAPGNLTATAASSNAINLGWTDNASTETGFRIEKMDGATWTTLAILAANVTVYEDIGLAPETTYSYRVCAYDAFADSDWSNTASDTTPASVTADHLALSDIPVAGTVSGTYAATQSGSDNGAYQSITEVESADRLAKKRYSYLEHKWTFNIQSGNSHVFHVQAYRSASTDGDNFGFAYSTDGVNFTNMVTVTKTTDGDGDQTFVIPAALSGTVWVRVRDTDRTKTHVALDTIYIDHMFIRSE